MSFATCLTKLKDYVDKSGLADNVTPQRLEYFAKRLEAVGSDSMTPAEFAAKSQEFIEGEFAREAAARKAANLQTSFLREQNLRNLVENTQAWKEAIAGGKKDLIRSEHQPATEAFRVWQEGGGLRPGEGTNLSVDLMASQVKSQLWSIFRQALGDLEKPAAVGAFDKNALLELDAIDRGSKLGTTNDPNALEYAKALKIIRDKVFSMEQAKNPFLMRSQEYLWMQMHDMDRIGAMKKEDWVSLAMKTFGEKSYPELAPAEKIGKFSDAYDKIIAGKWGSTLPEYEPGQGGNILRRQAASRNWQASNAEAFADYNAQAGPATIYDGLDKIISRSSKDIALLNKAGPTPDLMRDQLMHKFQQTLEPAELVQFKKDTQMLDKKWEVVKGAQSGVPADGVAKTVSNAMTLAYLAKTGASMVHAAPGDLALSSNLLKQLDQGSLFGHAYNLVKEVGKSFVSSDYRSARMEELGLFGKSSAQELQSQFGSAPATGVLGKMSSVFSSLTGYNRWVDSMQTADGVVISRMLGRQADTAHADLHASWKQGLARYSIGENDWNAARFAKDQTLGYDTISPRDIRTLPDEVVENALRKNGQLSAGKEMSPEMATSYKDDLETKLGVMINEHGRLGTAHTDTRQRSFMWGDTNINEGIGQLRRLITQFKAATITSADVYRRGYLSSTTSGGDWSGVMGGMILAGFMTGVSKAAFELATGKTPEEITAPNTAALAVESGVMGAYGGILLGEFRNARGWQDRMNAGMSSALGPVLGTGFAASAIAAQGANELASGTPRPKAPGAAVKLGLSNIPGQNLIYTKAAFDYYFANQLKEFMGPGYLHALEKGTFERGQSYLFGKPTGQSFFEGGN